MLNQARRLQYRRDASTTQIEGYLSYRTVSTFFGCVHGTHTLVITARHDLTLDIEDLRRRLEALEVHLGQQLASGEEVNEWKDSKHGLYDPGSPDPRISEVELAFENDTRLGTARQLELENVEAIFDTKELANLRRLHHRRHCCVGYRQKRISTVA